MYKKTMEMSDMMRVAKFVLEMFLNISMNSFFIIISKIKKIALLLLEIIKDYSYSNENNRQMHLAELNTQQRRNLTNDDVKSGASGEAIDDRVAEILGNDAEVKDGKEDLNDADEQS